MDFLPIFLKLDAQRCLVVGGGHVALRKVSLLLRAGAHIRLVAPKISDELRSLLHGQCHQILERPFEDADIEEVKLIIAATDDNALNQRVYELGSQRHVPVNVVDTPELCDFIFPSIVDRSPVVVAVSSGGNSPVLARLLRARLETLIPSAYGTLASLLGDFRSKAKLRIRNMSQRMRFWETIVNGPVAELHMSGQGERARQLLEEKLEQAAAEDKGEGEVYLVGAGPGDPDLLTFRALRLMQQADIVLYDRLVAPQILDMVRQDAERVHVGKQRSQHTMAQQDISRLLVRLAQEGKRVLRLKGGDPFIFGRGGEEIQELAEAGIPFQVIPGITAASGCAAYCGIPLTHRDYAQSVRFVTGHLKNDSNELDWPRLVQANETLVFYMGLVGLTIICEQLIAHGRSPETPIALIEQGTTPQQKVHAATLATMPALVESLEVRPPTLIIVGEVVKLHETLAWRNDRNA